MQIEESVYLAGTDGPRRTVQIVIYGKVSEKPAVRWSLRHIRRSSSPAPARPRGRAGNCRCKPLALWMPVSAIHSAASCASS